MEGEYAGFDGKRQLRRDPWSSLPRRYNLRPKNSAANRRVATLHEGTSTK